MRENIINRPPDAESDKFKFLYYKKKEREK